MAEKLTLKKLSGELEQLRSQMQELEAQLERRFEARLKTVLVAVKPATQPAKTSVSQAGIDTEQRQRLITDEAYLIAERRGFQGGDPAQDWVDAEKLVDYRLMHPGDPGQPATGTPKPRKARAAKKPGTTRKTAAKTAGSVKS